ncbi:MAG: 1,4-alpha-glucan branching protein GlgB [Firmicutes bacterium]|nr:1,4-alpha-glucan branching protein GlgB [Bacillota bacterium]
MASKNTKKDESAYLFHQGTMYHAHKFMGCQLTEGGAIFRVVAPNARSVSVIGDFNDWNTQSHCLNRISDKGLFELEILDIKEGDKYKFCVTSSDGRELIKCDPYAFYAEQDGGRASIAYKPNKFNWGDKVYMERRNQKNIYASPINIYEAHIGSWKKHPDGRYYTYREFADTVISHLTELSYTHLELIGIAEHPFDGSWGYQVTGYFAPTSRYGTPDDFAYLVNKCHKNDIAVILDWVPGHFPKDDFGLANFDGTPFYEAQGNQRQEHKEWGTLCFDYGREEVQSFLVSNAVYWFENFHIDGLRVDAVASMLYLDYNRENGQWSPNTYGGRENLDAIAFLRKVNSTVFELFGGNIMMIAEESTAYPMVTKPISDGGLGFNFKWNMGWMNDSLTYASLDPVYRKHLHNNLTFSMTYAFSENYILPISHDEIVHGKKSLVDKMPGNYDLKLAGWRNFLMNMYSHPGKKLLMMGSEFAQFVEWDYKRELEWFLIGGYPAHASSLDFIKAMNRLYKDNPPFWTNDYNWEGFEWLVVDDSDNNVIAYHRHALNVGADVSTARTTKKTNNSKKSDKNSNQSPTTILCAYNFSPIELKDYTIGISKKGRYKVVLESTLYTWNNDGYYVEVDKKPAHNKPYSITGTLPPMSGIWAVLEEE